VKEELHHETNQELQDLAVLMSFDRIQNLATQSEGLKQNIKVLEDKSASLQKNLLKHKVRILLRLTSSFLSYILLCCIISFWWRIDNTNCCEIY